MKNLIPTPRLDRIFALGLIGLFLTPICSADSSKHWNNLQKVAKPSHEGIHAELKSTHTFLSFGGRSTCIPKNCVLNLPESLATRVTAEPKFEIVDWFEFLNVNFSWIGSYPVTWEQVTGRQTLTDETLKNLSKSSTLMIATYRRNPISVPPLQDLEEVATNNQ